MPLTRCSERSFSTTMESSNRAYSQRQLGVSLYSSRPCCTLLGAQPCVFRRQPRNPWRLYGAGVSRALQRRKSCERLKCRPTGHVYLLALHSLTSSPPGKVCSQGDQTQVIDHRATLAGLAYIPQILIWYTLLVMPLACQISIFSPFSLKPKQSTLRYFSVMVRPSP